MVAQHVDRSVCMYVCMYAYQSLYPHSLAIAAVFLAEGSLQHPLLHHCAQKLHGNHNTYLQSLYSDSHTYILTYRIGYDLQLYTWSMAIEYA